MGGYRFAGRDGVELAWHEIGSGRPLILLPGFGGTGSRMLEHGPADARAVQGHRIVLPDFRGYGDSAKPRDPTGYPPDVLADDGFALVEHLGLWITPGRLEALIPGRIQSRGGTAEVPRGAA